MILPEDVFERCALVSERWDDLLEAVEAKNTASSEIAYNLAVLLEDLEDQVPDNDDYYTMMSEQYLCSQILGNQALMKMAADDDSLDEINRAIIGQWMKRGAFYTIFRIVERVEGDLFEIVDIDTNEHFRLLSPGLRKLQNSGKSRNATYITLVVDNGLCLQSAGMIHYNRLNTDDVRFLTRVVDELLYMDEGLDGVLKEYSEVFGVLFRLSNIPTPKLGEFLLQAHIGYADAIDYDFQEPYWHRIECEDAVQYIFRKPTASMVAAFGNQRFFESPGPFNIRVFDLGEWWILLTHAKEAYDTFASILDCPTLQLNDRCSTVLMLMLEEEGYYMPWSPCSLFDDSEDDELSDEDSEHLAKINGFIREYVTASNEGRTIDIKRLAKRQGIDQKDADALIEQVEAMFARHLWEMPSEEAQYQVSGAWNVPSPVMLQRFGDSLSSSSVFFTLDTEEGRERFNANTQGLYRDKVEQYGIAELVETLFVETFGGDPIGNTVLSLLLWIVLEKRDEPVLVRSIAVEAFKAIPILHQQMSLEEFVKVLSDATIKAFVSTSLFKVTGRPRGASRHSGLYTVQATSLLSYLFTQIPHSV